MAQLFNKLVGYTWDFPSFNQLTEQVDTWTRNLKGGNYIHLIPPPYLIAVPGLLAAGAGAVYLDRRYLGGIGLGDRALGIAVLAIGGLTIYEGFAYSKAGQTIDKVVDTVGKGVSTGAEVIFRPDKFWGNGKEGKEHKETLVTNLTFGIVKPKNKRFTTEQSHVWEEETGDKNGKVTKVVYNNFSKEARMEYDMKHSGEKNRFKTGTGMYLF